MDTDNSDFDIAVIGAGLSGTCAAILAAHSGARVVLLESGIAARHKVCGEFLSPESRVQLTHLGVEGAMIAGGAREIGAARVLTSARASRSVAFAHPGLSFSRHALDGLLWARAQEVGVDARERSRVSRLEQSAAGDFSIGVNGETLRAHFVIAATGRGSKWGRDGDTALSLSPRVESPGSATLPAVSANRNASSSTAKAQRAHNGNGFPPERARDEDKRQWRKPTNRFLGLKTHLRGARIKAGEVQMFPFAGGYCGLVEVEDGAFNTCLLVDYARSNGRSPAQVWDEVRRENRALGQATQGATLDFDWLATGNVSFDRFAPARDGILRVGDAAGYIHPLSGDGMAMALRSGELAARAVGHALNWDLSPEDAASSYSSMWEREFGSRLRWAARLQPLFTDPRLTRIAQGICDFAPVLSRMAVRRTRGTTAL